MGEKHNRRRVRHRASKNGRKQLEVIYFPQHAPPPTAASDWANDAFAPSGPTTLINPSYHRFPSTSPAIPVWKTSDPKSMTAGQPAHRHTSSCDSGKAYAPRPPLPTTTMTTTMTTAPWPNITSVRASYAHDDFGARERCASVFTTLESVPCRGSEDIAARDRRVFGGTADDGESVAESDFLRARMLDVVLGLFDGVDYADD